MSYIVIDLEWNQAMSSKSSVFNHLPIHLRGEIIQIGAVKLNGDNTPGEEFQRDVRPVWFRKMHQKVKKLTGFDNERLANGLPFPQAIREFLDWCGPDCTFMTWGYDDRGIMEQNLIIHDLDIDWLGNWINLQLIYNQQTDGDRNQKSLETAMEHFAIEQTRVAHDALGDAFNTALVCSRLDIPAGVKSYHEIVQSMTKKVKPKAASKEPEPLVQSVSHCHNSKEALWTAVEAAGVTCPICGKPIAHTEWVNQGDGRYMALAPCEEDGTFLLRIRIRREEDGSWRARRLIYQADEAMQRNFLERQAHPRRRKRSRRKKTQT